MNETRIMSGSDLLKAVCADCLKPLPDCSCLARARRGLPPSRNRRRWVCGACRWAGFVLARNVFFQLQPVTCGRCGGTGEREGQA